ncbi:MAG: hypothetical protein DMD61_10410 [Gemmatimonadetes bacterium]|nr:MAG: hypothetical protein DMD61_10410 [Gemmatimonadota bacterium]
MVAAALGCSFFGPGDFSRVIAIEVSAPDSLEELDTLHPHAQALDGHFDSVPGTTFIWSTLDTAILTVLDSTTGRTVVNHPGSTPGSLLARAGQTFSNPVVIRALAAADTVYATPRTADTVHLSVDSLSDSLAVLVADTIESAGGGDSLTVPLAGRPVAYAITYPASPGPVTLVTSDTAHALVTADTVASGTAGIASVKLRLIAGPTPDSVLVTASARRAVGTAVPGSPVTFVVRFEP